MRRRMSVLYYSTKEKRTPGYGCFYEYNRHGGKMCQCFSSAGVDVAVAGLFLEVVSPAKIEIALHALEELESDHQEARRQWDLQLQRADYEVELARRRYEASDPENRLVSAELEATWEAALDRRERLRASAQSSSAGRSTRSARRTGSRSATSPPTRAGSGRRRRRRWRTARRSSVS